ncbi:hypothetical protein [Nocardia sp. N2S4-5]
MHEDRVVIDYIRTLFLRDTDRPTNPPRGIDIDIDDLCGECHDLYRTAT